VWVSFSLASSRALALFSRACRFWVLGGVWRSVCCFGGGVVFLGLVVWVFWGAFGVRLGWFGVRLSFGYVDYYEDDGCVMIMVMDVW